jgi:hypothetical protein
MRQARRRRRTPGEPSAEARRRAARQADAEAHPPSHFALS